MNKYHGIVPPLVTPMKGRDQLDRSGLERLLERVITGGVHGIFILGTTGEAPSLSYWLRREVIQLACKQIDGRLPVFVGISDTSIVESIKLAELAGDHGAEALVLAPPYYFPAGQDELIGYVEDILPQLPLPLMLYNFPSVTNSWFEIESLKRLSALGKIVGVKDSSGDLGYYEELCKLKKIRPDWSMLIGPEALMTASLDLGGDGGISGGANVFPNLFADCYTAKMEGKKEKVTELSRKIEMFQEVYTMGKHLSRFVIATKCCLSILGICSDYVEQPFQRFGPSQRAAIEKILEKMK